MKKEMLINVQPEESRVGILEDGVLEELYIERSSLESHVGNIYKGRIVNIESSIQAAFVDFGIGRNGFLHVSDVDSEYYKKSNDSKTDPDKSSGSRTGSGSSRGGRGRYKPPIQDIFRRGDEVLVQVIKEAVGTKGPTLSTYVSVPGRYLVIMPGLGRVGVSRKIIDEDIRRTFLNAGSHIRISSALSSCSIFKNATPLSSAGFKNHKICLEPLFIDFDKIVEVLVFPLLLVNSIVVLDTIS